MLFSCEVEDGNLEEVETVVENGLGALGFRTLRNLLAHTKHLFSSATITAVKPDRPSDDRSRWVPARKKPPARRGKARSETA